MMKINRLLALVVLISLPACAMRTRGEDPTKLVGVDVSVSVNADGQQRQIAIIGRVASVTDTTLVLNVTGNAAAGALRESIAFLESKGKVTTQPGPPLEVTIPREEIYEIARVDLSNWPPRLAATPMN